MTGPGRGSSGGSLVAYLLFITDCDPLVYGTEFFRFVDESRCFTGETKVLINNEVKNISKVKVGDTVINKYGEKDVVKNIRKFNIKEKVLKIYFEDNFIVCTQDHKWIVMDKHNNIIEKMAKDLDVKNDNLTRIK
jgi:hypothetical protein